MGKSQRAVTYKRRCAACGQREDPTHGLALHYNCLTCIACKSFFYRSGKQLRAAGVAESDMAISAVYEAVLDNHTRYTQCLGAGMEPALVLDPSKKAAAAKAKRSRGNGRSKASSSSSKSRGSRRASSSSRARTRDACTQTPPAALWPTHFTASHIPMLMAALAQATGSRAGAELAAAAAFTGNFAGADGHSHVARHGHGHGLSRGLNHGLGHARAAAQHADAAAAVSPRSVSSDDSGTSARIVSYPTVETASVGSSCSSQGRIDVARPAAVVTEATYGRGVGTCAGAGAGTDDRLDLDAFVAPLIADATLCDPLFQQLIFDEDSTLVTPKHQHQQQHHLSAYKKPMTGAPAPAPAHMAVPSRSGMYNLPMPAAHGPQFGLVPHGVLHE